MMTKKILIIILFLGFSLTLMDVALLVGTPSGQEVDLVEIQKKEKERRKKTKKSTRVITDEDLKNIKKEKVNITTVTSDPDDPAAKEENKTPGESDKVKNETENVDPRASEEYWREKRQAILKNMKEIEEAIKKAEENLARLKAAHLMSSTETLDQQLRRQEQIKNVSNQINNYKLGLENLEKAMEELREEARKAGAPKGWLRD